MSWLRRGIGILMLVGAIGYTALDAYVLQSVKAAAVTVDFLRGVRLAPSADAALADIAAQLKGGPDLVVRLEGHTALAGDAGANLALSEQRAAAVRDRLIALGIAENRITAVGLGNTEPLDRLDGEDQRSYDSRLGRVEARFEQGG
ncbi:MAG: OmpA family protein [Rhodospirillaceae bacterium]